EDAILGDSVDPTQPLRPSPTTHDPTAAGGGSHRDPIGRETCIDCVEALPAEDESSIAPGEPSHELLRGRAHLGHRIIRPVVRFISDAVVEMSRTIRIT